LLSECGRALGRIEEVEAATSEGVVTGGELSAGTLPHHSIRFDGVRFTYPGQRLPVFDGLDLEVPAGRSLAIVGQNGAGKTTLVKLLCRLYDPDRGRVVVDGVDLRDLRPDGPGGWHQRVSAVFQDYVQLELPAYDNIAYGALHRRDDADAVAEAARLAGADHVIGRLE